MIEYDLNEQNQFYDAMDALNARIREKASGSEIVEYIAGCHAIQEIILRHGIYQMKSTHD